MKINDLYNLRNAIVEIKDEKLPIKLAYNLAKFMKKTDSDIEFMFEKQREVLSSYSSENGDIHVPAEAKEKVNAALKEITEIDVDVPTLEINLSDISNLKLSVAVMNALSDFIVEK